AAHAERRDQREAVLGPEWPAHRVQLDPQREETTVDHPAGRLQRAAGDQRAARRLGPGMGTATEAVGSIRQRARAGSAAGRGPWRLHTSLRFGARAIHARYQITDFAYSIVSLFSGR